MRNVAVVAPGVLLECPPKGLRLYLVGGASGRALAAEDFFSDSRAALAAAHPAGGHPHLGTVACSLELDPDDATAALLLALPARIRAQLASREYHASTPPPPDAAGSAERSVDAGMRAAAEQRKADLAAVADAALRALLESPQLKAWWDKTHVGVVACLGRRQCRLSSESAWYMSLRLTATIGGRVTLR